MWILGLKGLNSNHLCDRYLITDVCRGVGGGASL